MLLLTITLEGTEHQIVLAFDTQAAVDDAETTLSQDTPLVVLADSYGQKCVFARGKIISITIVDVEQEWEYKNKVKVTGLRAENDFNMMVQADPTIKFLAGGRGPTFGSR